MLANRLFKSLIFYTHKYNNLYTQINLIQYTTIIPISSKCQIEISLRYYSLASYLETRSHSSSQLEVKQYPELVECLFILFCITFQEINFSYSSFYTLTDQW